MCSSLKWTMQFHISALRSSPFSKKPVIVEVADCDERCVVAARQPAADPLPQAHSRQPWIPTLEGLYSLTHHPYWLLTSLSQQMPPPEGMPDPNEKTYPCRVCGRKFVKSSLEKHEPVCKKLSKLHRKPFDSGKQRATGSDITIQHVRKAQKEKEKMGGTFPRPKTNWKERHESFIEAVAASKQVDYAIKTGAPLPPPPKTSIPSGPPLHLLLPSVLGHEEFLDKDIDYIQCEYCGRSFNEKAAERHIPFCRDQQMRKGPVKPTTAGKPRLPTHLQTRAPPTSSDRGRSIESRRGETRRGSLDRNPPPTTKGRPTANSAGTAHPIAPRTADRRSTSAPRSNSQSRLKQPNGYDAPPKSSNGYPPKTPNGYFPPKTPKSSNGRAPKTPGPRTPSRGRTPYNPPKTPKTSDSRRDTSTSRSRRGF